MPRCLQSACPSASLERLSHVFPPNERRARTLLRAHTPYTVTYLSSDLSVPRPQPDFPDHLINFILFVCPAAYRRAPRGRPGGSLGPLPRARATSVPLLWTGVPNY